MRIYIVLVPLILITLTSFSQSIPVTETVFPIHHGDKQQFEFSIQKGFTLKAKLMQMGVDLSISIYKKGDTSRLGYFDSPNGSYGPEMILFDAKTNGDYTLVVEPLAEDTVSLGKYSIRQLFIKVLGSRTDSAFANGSGIIIHQLNPVKVENLRNLGMIWGFLKYYHPAIAQGEYNWDAALFRIMPAIANVTSKSTANEILDEWVGSIGKPDSCLNCADTKKDNIIQQSPDYGNLFSAENLGASLVEKLLYIKNNRNQDENYYVELVSGIGNPDFIHENPYAKMIYPDAGYRLLTLYRYWNIIQYFFPYKYVIGEDWNKVLPEFIPKFINAKDSTAYALACLELIARVHDTHANIASKNNALTNWFGKFAAPFQGKFIENKLVVTRYFTDSFGIKEKIKIGDIITKINGQSVDQLVKDKLYLMPASNYETQLRNMSYYLLRSHKDSILLELTRDNKKSTVKVHCIEAGKINFYSELNLNPADSSYKIISGDIGYIFPGRYKNRQLPDIEKLFENTKGIIIDMRTYPSEFMPFTFGSYLKPNASPFVKFTAGDINYPGQFHMGPALNNGEINPNFYKGPIVELVNAYTQSQAEYTTMAFQTAPDITVIGSTTAGADGNVSPIVLPGGISTYISGIGVFYPDGTETQRKGVKIDIVVKPTIEGIKNGKDELLEKAIEIIRSKSKSK
jgi:C-terminal processing protease CtpA/Prc